MFRACLWCSHGCHATDCRCHYWFRRRLVRLSVRSALAGNHRWCNRICRDIDLPVRKSARRDGFYNGPFDYNYPVSDSIPGICEGKSKGLAGEAPITENSSGTTAEQCDAPTSTAPDAALSVLALTCRSRAAQVIPPYERFICGHLGSYTFLFLVHRGGPDFSGPVMCSHRELLPGHRSGRSRTGADGTRVSLIGGRTVQGGRWGQRQSSGCPVLPCSC
jgi:hypothetical protein